jgi:hypothetical protein
MDGMLEKLVEEDGSDDDDVPAPAPAPAPAKSSGYQDHLKLLAEKYGKPPSAKAVETTPTEMYGYGAPDEPALDYGYGDEDEVPEQDYGYGDDEGADKFGEPSADLDYGYGDEPTPPKVKNDSKRTSFRDSGSAHSATDISTQSAPGGRVQRQSVSGPRRVTISVGEQQGEFQQEGGVTKKSFFQKASVFAGATRKKSNKGNTSGNQDLMGAVERLEGEGGWADAAAAAAVVAATTQPSRKDAQQFGRDDQVLGMLTLLNMSNHIDDPLDFTTRPVNIHGYPEGEGESDDEREGPYSYVLCSIVRVHFDEDERYYTVLRGDSSGEQKAYAPYLEKIKGGARGIQAATKAASRTKRALMEEGAEAEKANADWFRKTRRFIQNQAIPFYSSTRAATKEFLLNAVVGSEGFSLRFNITTINFLVLCSFIFLFEDSFAIGFLPASMDRDATIVGV